MQISCWASLKIGLAGMEGEYVGDLAPDKCHLEELYLGHVGYKQDRLAAIQHNAGVPCNFTQLVPRLIVVDVMIEGYKACTLIDLGSLLDFISTTLVDQLNLKKIKLEKPILLHLVVQGSCSKINFKTKPRFQYQGIDEQRYFDVANLGNYDVILGTLFLFQPAHTDCLRMLQRLCYLH